MPDPNDILDRVRMEQIRERRRATRSEAWLTAGAHSALVTLLNVSRNGLAVSKAPAVPEGTLCRIEKGPLTTFAVVRWQQNDRLGLALAEPLSDRDAALFGIGRTPGRTTARR